MDQPIYYPRPHGCFKNPDNLYGRLCNAFYDDDKDEYLRLLQDPGFEEMRFSFYAQQVFARDAVNIATAVLNGETEGIIDVHDDLYDGETPLHLAANTGAPKITKYLIQRGDNVDVMCDYPRLNLKQATPLDVAAESAAIKLRLTLKSPLFVLLWHLCYYAKNNLEVVRLLGQRSQNKERVRQTFIDYAYKGKLVQLTVLFLAVPDLFLSPNMVPLEGGLSTFGKLHLLVNSLEKKTDIQEGLSLLLDMFAMIGDKLLAYVRLQDTHGRTVDTTKKEIDFLLRKVARKKLGVSFCDYYSRYFTPVIPGGWDDYPPGFIASDIYGSLSYLPKERCFDQAYILRLLPIMGRKNAVSLNRAIEKKVASMSTLHGCFEPIEKVSNIEEKYPHLEFPLACGSNKVMKQAMPKSFISTATVFQFPMKIAKYLIK